MEQNYITCICIIIIIYYTIHVCFLQEVKYFHLVSIIIHDYVAIKLLIYLLFIDL